MDAELAGTDGSITYERGSDGVVIPGSYRNQHKAANGSTVQLTIDDDIQFYVQQQVQQAKNLSGARNVSAVVLDAKSGEVLAMSNDTTFDPSQDIGRQGNKQMGNPAGHVPVRTGVGEQGRHGRLGNRVRAQQSRRGAAGARLDQHGRGHRARRVESRRGAVHHHRRVREVVQRRRADAGPARRPGPLLRHAPQVRAGAAHQRRAARRERRAGAAARPVVGQHLLQPAYRPRPFDDPAADDGDVSGDRQRRTADAAADHQGHHRIRRHPHRRASPGRDSGGIAGDRADGAQHASRSRAA